MNTTAHPLTEKIQIGVCCTPAESATLPPDAYDYVEANVQNFLVPEKGDEIFHANLAEAKLVGKLTPTACCFLPPDLKCVGPDIDEARLLKYAETAFRRAHETGIDTIVFGSGGARNMPPGYTRVQAMDDFVSILKKLGPLAAKYGIMIVVEPLNLSECNFITTLADGAEAVERANHPNIQLLADYYHMLKDGEPASEVVKYGPMIKHTHLSELAGRGCPGTSREDMSPFFDALDEIGYTGRMSLECIWKDLTSELAPSMKYLRGR